MNNKLPASANRTLKFAAIALFAFSTTTSMLAQEPMHALEQSESDRGTRFGERTGDETRPAPEVDLSVAQNPSPTGVFTVKSEAEDLRFDIYDESLQPIHAEISNDRPGTFVIDLSKLENGIYTMVASSNIERTLVDLIKRDSSIDDTKMAQISVHVYPNPSTGVFTLRADNDAIINIFDRAMRPVNAPIQNLFNKQHRIDLTNADRGIYFIQVTTKSGMATKQVSKR